MTMTVKRVMTASKTSSVTAARDIVAEMNSEEFAVLPGFQPREGHIYVRVRAISARINQNYDGFPSDELRRAYKTFLGKPCFVNHVNDDPNRRRGRVVASKYCEAGDDKYIDVFMEVNAVKFPLLAKEIIEAGIDAVSMGCSAERTICSYCGNTATGMFDMCEHVVNHKGSKLRRMTAKGPEDVLVYEECRDIGFFELSFVFDPADETALASKVLVANRNAARGAGSRVWCDMPGCRRWAVVGSEGHQEWVSGNGEQRTYDYCSQGHKDQYEKSYPDWLTTASVRNAYKRRAARDLLGFGEVEAPQPVDTLRPDDEREDEFHQYVESPDFMSDPDLEKAQELDRREELPEGFEDVPMEDDPMSTPRPEAPGVDRPDQNPIADPIDRRPARSNGQSAISRKGSTMSRDSLAQRGRVASRARVAEDKSRNDQGDREEEFITQTPPPEPVETADGDEITNTEQNLVAQVRAGRAAEARLQSLRKRKARRRKQAADDKYYDPITEQYYDNDLGNGADRPAPNGYVWDPITERYYKDDGTDEVLSRRKQAEAKRLLAEAQGEVPEPKDVTAPDEREDLWEAPEETQPKDAAKHAYRRFAAWVRKTQGKGLRQASSKGELLRWAGQFAKAAGLDVGTMYPIVRHEIAAHRKKAAEDEGPSGGKADADAVEEFIKDPGDASEDKKESRRRKRAADDDKPDFLKDDGDDGDESEKKESRRRAVAVRKGDVVELDDEGDSYGKTYTVTRVTKGDIYLDQEGGGEHGPYDESEVRLARRQARKRKTADEKLDVAAPDGRIDVERPTRDTTDEDAQQGQFDLDDFGDNAGDDLADPDLTTDQNWLPGEGKRSSKAKLASGMQAVRLAEAMITANLDDNKEGRWNLAQKFERMPASFVANQTALLERVIAANGLDRRSAEKKTAGNRGVSRVKSTIPPNLMQATPQRREASAEVGNPDSDMFL